MSRTGEGGEGGGSPAGCAGEELSLAEHGFFLPLNKDSDKRLGLLGYIIPNSPDQGLGVVGGKGGGKGGEFVGRNQRRQTDGVRCGRTAMRSYLPCAVWGRWRSDFTAKSLPGFGDFSAEDRCGASVGLSTVKLAQPDLTPSMSWRPEQISCLPRSTNNDTSTLIDGQKVKTSEYFKEREIGDPHR